MMQKFKKWQSYAWQERTKDKHYNLIQRLSLGISKSFLTKKGDKPSEISRKAAETLLIYCCSKHVRQTAILILEQRNA